MPVLGDDKQFTPEQTVQHVQQLELKQKRLLTQLKSTHSVAPEQNQEQEQPQKQKSERMTGEDLVQRSLEIARMEAEIYKSFDAYQKMPRRKFIGARTQEYRFAQYVEDWRIKVERIGNLNYPEAARQQRILWQPATHCLHPRRRQRGKCGSEPLVRASASWMRRHCASSNSLHLSPRSRPISASDTDILTITRTWTFTQSDKLESE